MRRCHGKSRDMRRENASQSVEWGLLAQMSAEEVRCAYGSCQGERELKIPCALVKEKSRCALTKCHLGRWDKGRMRTCQEMQGGIFWNDFSEVFNAGGRFEIMHFFSLHNSFRVSYKEKSWLEVWSSRI